MNSNIKKTAMIICGTVIGCIGAAALVFMYILKFIRRYEENRVIRIAGKITKDILNNEEFIGI